MSSGWRKLLQRKLTLIVVPHFHLPSRQINISVFWLVVLMTFSLGLFGWAGGVIIQHLDYARLKMDNHLLRSKTVYFANEVRQSRIMLDQVKDLESNLRSLLKMPSRKEIIRSQKTDNSDGASGGADLTDQLILEKLLAGRLGELTTEELKGNLANLHQESRNCLAGSREIGEFIKNLRNTWLATPNCWPTKGRVTSLFGARENPISSNQEFHQGLDIANDKNTPVYATADGLVKLASWEGGYGKLVVIDHGYGLSSRYAHNSKLSVKAGQHVKRNQIISYMGSTGRATGSHLHYEVWKNGQAVNPRKFLTDTLN
ncbi:MAG: M23 family metallopeptidase [Elusimicrobiota bacterium]